MSSLPIVEDDSSPCDTILPHYKVSKCQMDLTLAALDELERFLSETDVPREKKNRQKLLRNLKVRST